MVALASLRTKVVRDLWWAATSPGLLVASVDGARFVGDDVGRALVVAAGDWLLELDADAAPLRAFLATADAKRLGFYFSALVEFWITRCPALGTRAWRLYQQLRHAGDARRVVGALKYVFACDPEDAALRKALLRGSDAAPNGGALGKIVCHWEASIKFFVYSRVDGGESAAESEDSDGLCDYVGPFLHENLAARVVTTKRKLQLCASRAVQAWLRKEILDGAEGAAPDECAAFQSASILRGYLFYHRDAGGADGGEDDAAEAANDGAHRHVPARYRALPGAVSLGHARGWWTESINGVPRPKQTTHWIVLSKAHWLCPARVPRVEGGWALAEDALVGAAHERACASISDLAARVSEHLRAAPCTPIMVACLEAVPDGSLLEASRGFVVPQEWDPAPLVGAPTWWRRREACTQPTLARMHMRGVYARPSDGADDDGDDVIVGFPRGEDDVVVARTAAVESAEELLIELQGQPSPHVKKGRSLAAFKLAQRCADLLAATEAAHGADRGAALVVESLALVANRRDMPVPLAFRLGAGLLDGHDLRRQSRGREAPLPEKVLAAVERVVDDAIETAHLELTLALRLGAHFGAARESPRRSAGTVLTPTVALDLKPRFEAALDASLASPEASRKKLATVARIMGLVGRPRAVVSSRLALAAACLAASGDLHAAEDMVTAPVAGAETDELCVDVVAAERLVEACFEQGHSKWAKNFRKRYLAPDEDSEAPRRPSLRAGEYDDQGDTAKWDAFSNPPVDEQCPELDAAPAATWVADASGLAKVLAAMDCPTLDVAVDTEWGASADLVGPCAPPALMQLALSPDERCFLVDVTACLAAAPAALSALLRRVFSAGAPHRVLGFAFSRDRARLEPLFGSCGIVVDLQRRGRSLQATARLLLRRRLEKACQCSAWDARPLTAAQLAYAALDAAVLLRLAAALDRGPAGDA